MSMVPLVAWKLLTNQLTAKVNIGVLLISSWTLTPKISTLKAENALVLQPIYLTKRA